MIKYFAIITLFLLPTNLFAGGHCVVQKNVQHVDVVRQKVVEFNSDYYLGLQGYYDVVQELRAQSNDNDTIKAQQAQIDRLLSLLENALGKKPADNKTEPPARPDVEPPKPIESTLDEKVFTIFNTKCANCHTGNDAKKGLQLVGKNEDGSSWLNNLSLEDRVLVYDVTAGVNLANRGKKLMPLGGPPLSDEEVEILRLWMIEKAGQNKEGKK